MQSHLTCRSVYTLKEGQTFNGAGFHTLESVWDGSEVLIRFQRQHLDHSAITLLLPVSFIPAIINIFNPRRSPSVAAFVRPQLIFPFLPRLL